MVYTDKLKRLRDKRRD